MASFFDFSKSLVPVILIIAISVILLSGLKNRPAILISFLLVTFAIGGWRFSIFSKAENNLDKFTGQEVVLTGYVDDEPKIDGNIQRFAFNSDGTKILVTTSAYPRYKFGDNIKVIGELELPKNFTDFDYVAYLKKDGIRTTLFFPEITKFDDDLSLGFREGLRTTLYKRIFLLKDAFQNAVNGSVSEPNAAFINGILLGSRQNIPDDLREAFNRTGTTHILAISGYNIMIISWAVLSGLIWFFKRRTAFWISVGIIVLFVILTGASASVVRAAMMGLLLSFANGYGRLYDQKNSIILAGGVMVYHNPFVLVFDIGFQLSFAAVLGLIYLYPYVDSKLYKVPRLGDFKELFLMTLSAQIAVAPLLVYYFKNFSIVSLPANILILPFVPVSMSVGFITGLAGMIYLPLGQLLGHVAWAITSYQIQVVKLFT